MNKLNKLTINETLFLFTTIIFFAISFFASIKLTQEYKLIKIKNEYNLELEKKRQNIKLLEKDLCNILNKGIDHLEIKRSQRNW